MTNAELAVTAALGASLLSGLASLGVVALQQLLAGRSADSDALISEMLATARLIAVRSRSVIPMQPTLAARLTGR